jgi:2-methylisocitrate lyase-like PEP mutase family enzyme
VPALATLMSMPTASPPYTTFRALHANGCFVIPNPWDVGSAKYLQHLGFKALATTSAGFAFSRGLADGTLSLDDMLTHISEIVAATDLPVNADFGRAFADEAEQVSRNVADCIATGVAGLSVEDATGDDSRPLYDFDLAVDRIRAARQAIDESETSVLLTARAECYLVNHSAPFAESLKRLEAYADAGADVLYAPGVTERDEINSIVSAVAPKPVNVLIGSDIGLGVADLAAMGVRRISVGSSLARAAWTGFIRAAEEIAKRGTFGGFGELTPYNQLNRFFQLQTGRAEQ